MIPPRSQRHLLVRGGTVVTQDRDARVLEADLLLTEGKIAAVGADLRPPPATRLLEAQGMVVIPGLVQSHVHLGHVLYRGRVRPREIPWRDENISRLDLAHDDDTAYWSTLLGAVECLLSGTTTVSDFGLPRGMSGVYCALLESGIRATTGPCLGESVGEARAELEAMQARHDSARGRLRAEIHLSSAESLPEIWETAVAWARSSRVRLQTHVSGRDASYREMERLQEVGALDAGLTLAHGLLLERASVENLGQRTLGIAHCPASEARLAGGAVQISSWAKDDRVHIGLGCGGVAGTGRFDLFEEMRLGVTLQTRFGEGSAWKPPDALRAATRGSAQALGLDSELGSLELGKAGDLVVLDLRGAHGFAHPDATLPERVVARAGRSSIRWVVVDGEVLVENGRMPHLDLEALTRKPDEAARTLFERAEEGRRR